MKPLQTQIENAPTFLDWLRNRGGIAVWNSVNLSNPGISWSTPALEKDGQPYGKPNWQVGSQPDRIITSPDDVLVSVDQEVKRFRVGVRMGSQGLSLKVTDGGSRRIRAAVEKAGEGAYHTFDYFNQEAVIMKPEKTVSLTEWEKQQQEKQSHQNEHAKNQN